MRGVGLRVSEQCPTNTRLVMIPSSSHLTVRPHTSISVILWPTVNPAASSDSASSPPPASNSPTRAASGTPAQLLVGRQLAGGWYVEERVDRAPDATGGHFSTSYIVRSPDGRKAFLKAMDYQQALTAPDPAQTLHSMTAAYNFEREMLARCREHKLTRVVRIVGDGSVSAREGDPSSVVQYLIFELATGDIRSVASFGDATDHAWILRTIHNATAALRQLHNAHIAHQDLKPSNILLFPNDHSKLADLGRSYHRHITSPHDDLDWAGDVTYAPPELLYGHVHPEWRTRRIATDLYLLGSLIMYLYTGVSMTHFLLNRLDGRHHYDSGIEYRDVLPYLQRAFAQILREVPDNIPSSVASEIRDAVVHLCHLDPEKRGHPRNAQTSDHRYSLERYVSVFDRLANKAEWSARQIVRWVK